MENNTFTDYDETLLPQTAIRYLGYNLSVIPVRDDKRPAIAAWSAFQTNKMSDEFVNQAFSHPGATGIAIICGAVSGHLEVIDVDCKYDHTGMLWNDFFALIRQYLPELSGQLVIATTKNNGYHIYYRCTQEEGNQKLANNAHKEVLIETRGNGGYVIAAPSPGYRFIQGALQQIPCIAPSDREMILSLARSFDEQASPVPKAPSPYDNNEYDGVSPFDDYNQNADAVQLLAAHSWKVVRQSGSRVYLQRPGKSGKDYSANYHLAKRIFYPFTTSTIFEAQRGYNPVQLFTLLECNGDYSAASRKLAQLGYGKRGPLPGLPTLPLPETALDRPTPPFPVNTLPRYLQGFISICSKSYRSSPDYWAGAVLIATALAIGDKLELVDKYENVPILWLVLVGDVSTGKTFPLQYCLNYFKQLDKQSINQYDERLAEYERLIKLSAQERREEGIYDRPVKPECFQYILNDFTPEAMVAAHKVNNRGVLIERDELKGWIDDFNRYNKSGEQSNMLSAWSRVGITYNRKNSGILNIAKPCILVGGGMQPDLLPTLAADNRAENGFLSRFCAIFPDNACKGEYNEEPLPPDIGKSWEIYLSHLIGIPTTIRLQLSEEALNSYADWFNRNARQINQQSSGYLKGIFGKLDIISLRLAIILHGMNLACDQECGDRITAREMESALQITEYFRTTALKVYRLIFEKEKPPKSSDNPTDNKKIANYLYRCHVQKNEIAQLLRTSRSQIDRLIS